MAKKKFKIEKLIRDKLLDKMQSLNQTVHYKILNDTDYVQSLKEKLLEECREVSEENDPKALAGELGDLYEVAEALMNVLGISFEELLKAKQAKKEKNGSFEKRLYVSYTEVDNTNPAIKYFLNQPHKYPETS